MNIRMSSLILAGVLALGSLGLVDSAHAQNYRDRHHDRQDDRYEVCNYCGTVRSITRINKNSRRTGATVVGALIGGALGNQVGKGDGRKAATVAGAVAGGVIANQATRDDRRRTYYRVEVRMENGRIHRFDQSNAYGLRVGMRVEIHDGMVHRAR